MSSEAPELTSKQYVVTGTVAIGRNPTFLAFEIKVSASDPCDAETEVRYLLCNHRHSEVEVAISSITKDRKTLR